MVKYFGVICVVLVAFFSVFSPMDAQSPCGDLNRADCDILQTAQVTTGNLSSASFEANAELTFGIQFFPEIVFVRVATSGVYTRVPVTDNTDMEEAYRELLGLNADMSLFIDAEISEFIAPDDNTLTTALDLRYVDGIGYAELSKVLPLINPLLEAGGWYSVDVISYLARLIRDGIFPSDFLDLLSTSASFDYWSGIAIDGSNRRLDDAQIGEQSFAVFEASLFARDYFDESPNTRDLFLDAFEDLLQTQYGGFYSDKDLLTAATYYVDLISNMQFNLTHWVNLEDGYIHETQFDFVFAPDADTPAQFSPDPLGISLLSTAELRFSFDFRYTQFEDVPLVRAPEDASPVRYEDIFGFGDSSPF